MAPKMRSWRMWSEEMSWGRSLHQISSNTTMIVLLSNYNGPGIVKAMSPRSGNQWLSVAKWNKRDEKNPLSRFILHAFTFTRNFHLRNNPLLGGLLLFLACFFYIIYFLIHDAQCYSSWFRLHERTRNHQEKNKRSEGIIAKLLEDGYVAFWRRLLHEERGPITFLRNSQT